MTDDEDDAPSTTLHSDKADRDGLETTSASTGTHSPPHKPIWATPSMLVKLHEVRLGILFCLLGCITFVHEEIDLRALRDIYRESYLRWILHEAFVHGDYATIPVIPVALMGAETTS